MSTGLDCQFIENKKGWTYIIEVPGLFRVKRKKHGPFSSIIDAKAHMDARYPNPGSWTEIPLKGRTR